MTRWYHWLILAGLIALGAALRFYQITRVGQWPDEFWSSVYLATGRGSTIFQLPIGVLINPPPQTLLAGAPAWPHIWTSLSSICHPPLYLIVLRWWMDLFGSGDLATRAFSVAASLAAAVVLFDVLRLSGSPQAGLIAAALMVVSPLQIDLSQQARPYPLLVLFGLLGCHAIVRIERYGATTARLIQFALFFMATALTHYFAFGGLVAIFLYALIRLRGETRRKVIAAIVCVGVLVLVCWGPFFWQQRQQFSGQGGWAHDRSSVWAMPFIRMLALPSAYLYGRPEPMLAWIAPSAVVYLLPIIFIRRAPHLFLWWLWVVGIVGSLAVYDFLSHGLLMALFKYTSLASVGVYALCAVPFPVRQWWRWLVPGMFLAGTMAFTVARIQQGPSEENGDWRGFALLLDQKAGPNDAVIIYPNSFWGSGMYYIAFAHYAQNTRRPIMFLDQPAGTAALKQLSQFQRIWVIGPEEMSPAEFLPGWKPTFIRGFPHSAMVSSLVPEKSNSAATFPSGR